MTKNDEKKPAPPPPSVGRVVHFHADEEPHAALIVGVNADGTCELTLFGRGNDFGGQLTKRRESVPFSELPTLDHWTWPPRV